MNPAQRKQMLFLTRLCICSFKKVNITQPITDCHEICKKSSMQHISQRLLDKTTGLLVYLYIDRQVWSSDCATLCQ